MDRPATVRLITRNDTSLAVALIAASVIIFRQPLRYVLDLAQEIEGRFHLDLVPALLLLVAVFTFHQYRKRLQAKAEALASAADAAQARAQSRTLQQLMTLGQALANALDRDALQQVLWKHLPAIARDRRFWVVVREGERWEVLLQDRTDSPRSVEELERLAIGTLNGEPSEGDACFPMLAAGAVVGVLGLADAATLSDEQHNVVGAAAAVIAIGVKNMQLFLNARESSLRDGLTGCFNRGHAIQVIDAELHRVRRTGTPLSILMFDIDHFKTVNDRLGHLRGDELLGAIGAQLARTLRTSDVRCRYGGDEFLVILPDTPVLGAQQVAEGLRQAIAALKFGDANRTAVTISVGVAAAIPGELDVNAFIDRADDALYRAKRTGRNRLCVAVPPSLAEALPARVS